MGVTGAECARKGGSGPPPHRGEWDRPDRPGQPRPPTGAPHPPTPYTPESGPPPLMERSRTGCAIRLVQGVEGWGVGMPEGGAGAERRGRGGGRGATPPAAWVGCHCNAPLRIIRIPRGSSSGSAVVPDKGRRSRPGPDHHYPRRECCSSASSDFAAARVFSAASGVIRPLSSMSLVVVMMSVKSISR